HQDERGVFCGAKRIQQQRKNEQHADRHNQCQTLHRALLVLELTAPGDVISRRQFDLLRNTILHLADEAAHIAVLDENADGHDARAELTADIQAALLDGNRCQRIERDPRAGGRIHKYPFYVCSRSSSPSGPNTLITICPSICEMLSSTLSRMGCEKDSSTPGKTDIFCENCSISFSRVSPCGHSAGGFRSTKNSVILIGFG